MGLFSTLCFMLEILVAILCALVVFFAVLNYLSLFIERHVHFASRFINLEIYTNFFLYILGLFSKLSILSVLFAAGANLGWVFVMKADFPFVELAHPLFLVSCVLTIASHIMLTYDLVGMDISVWSSVCIFVQLVWIVPLIIILSLSTVEEEDVKRRNHGKSIVSAFITKYFKAAVQSLPHRGDKNE